MKAIRQRAAGRRLVGILSLFLVVGGTLLLLVWAFIWMQARAYQARYSRGFDSSAYTSENHAKKTSTDSPPTVGSAIGKIEVPRIGLSVVVLEGDDDRTLRLGAGHIPGTASLGNAGNTGVAAHRDTFFRPLRFVRSGDLIRIRRGNQTYDYRVQFTEIVTPYDVQVLNATAQPALTLVTCYPFFYIGSAPKRFIVRAQLLRGSTKS